MHSPRFVVLALATTLATACGSPDPVSYSAPVGISLNVKSGDVTAGQVRVDKNISTESGNPYGAFVNAAEKALGRPPSRIVVTSATLTLHPATSTQVTLLEQVFSGAVQLSFETNGSKVTYLAASAPRVTGVGPVSMTNLFDSQGIPASELPDLVSGAFKVVLGGAAVSGFSTQGATADLTATFTFEAYP